ncbi:PilN domain-containing protein [Acetobacter sp.]|uniref:PilN domain-containing protein n=1 Tax=Acetobacter sp. TaxID=440 RepID=UPI0039E96E3B
MISSISDHRSGILQLFATWWARQMLDCVPKAWRIKRAPAVHLTLDDVGCVPEAELTAFLEKVGKSRGKKAANVSLVLPVGVILRRKVSLPAVAASDMAQVIAYDFDRLTPFRADEVVWTLQSATPVGEGATISVELLFAPRFVFENAFTQLRQYDITVTSLVTLDSRGEPDSEIPLKQMKAAGRSRWKPILAACLILAFLPFGMQIFHMVQLDRAIAALSAGRAQAEELRSRISSYTAGPAAVARETKTLGVVPNILQALTTALPDDTYLTDLHIHERRVTMDGQTKESPHLIGILEHEASFSGVAFSGPVTHAGDTNLEAFTINATAPE